MADLLTLSALEEVELADEGDTVVVKKTGGLLVEGIIVKRTGLKLRLSHGVRLLTPKFSLTEPLTSFFVRHQRVGLKSKILKRYCQGAHFLPKSLKLLD